jgi:hypothetical protein
MPQKRVRPDSITFVGVLNICASVVALEDEGVEEIFPSAIHTLESCECISRTSLHHIHLSKSKISWFSKG